MTNGLEQNLLNGFYQSVIGSYALKKNPNQFGELGYATGKAGYASSMQSEDAQSLRHTEAERATALGIDPENMSYINSDWTLLKVKEIREESFRNLTFGQLEDVMGNIAPGFEFNVDDTIRDMSYMDIMSEISQDGDLLDEEKYAINVFKYFSKSYDTTLALKHMNSSYIQGLNVEGQRINEDFRGTPEE